MNDPILNKLDELINMLGNNEDYKEYLLLREKVLNNKEIVNLIAEVKDCQKLLVKREHNNEPVEELEKKLDDLNKSLNEYPLYCDFIEKQGKLNLVYDGIASQLQDCIDKNVG